MKKYRWSALLKMLPQTLSSVKMVGEAFVYPDDGEDKEFVLNAVYTVN